MPECSFLPQFFYFSTMRKALYAGLPIMLIIACNSSESKQPAIIRDTPIANNHIVITPETAEIPAEDEKDSLAVIGNFDGDNIPDSGYFVLVHKSEHQYEPENEQVKGEEDDHADSVIYEYLLRFKGNRVGELRDIKGAAVYVINEGDLNHDGKDEITVFSKYIVTCMNNVSCYTFREGKWVQIEQVSFNSCVPYDEDELQAKIVMKNGVPWFYESRDAVGFKLKLSTN
jgi:hypothetical protein